MRGALALSPMTISWSFVRAHQSRVGHAGVLQAGHRGGAVVQVVAPAGVLGAQAAARQQSGREHEREEQDGGLHERGGE